MGRPTKRTQLCRKLANKKKKSKSFNNTVFHNYSVNNDFTDYFTDITEESSNESEVEDWNDDQLNEEAEDLFKKNGQTLLNYFNNIPSTSANISKKKSYDSEQLKKAIFDINNIKLDKEISPGQKLRIEAIKYYLQLQQNGQGKVNASLIIAQLFNRGEWFAKCVRSWGNTFINFRTIPKSKRGQHFHIRNILNDENVHSKMISFLREHKFDITPHQVCEYFSNDIAPSLGLKGPQAEFVVKKYKSHRTVPDTILKEFDSEFKDQAESQEFPPNILPSSLL
ncbi:3560_t:CDS:2 [Acaulospora morrowiae]|uniref:3560_t:CDS:1 n=1 Tax=Acaulospora morrowiae TaxID=94023 RepID=A0A9N8V3E4_9GLOM|nr:3560_t:CDS:2 [Acaulospora morrowiae]